MAWMSSPPLVPAVDLSQQVTTIGQAKAPHKEADKGVHHEFPFILLLLHSVTTANASMKPLVRQCTLIRKQFLSS